MLCHAYNTDRLDLLSSVDALLLPHALVNLPNKDSLEIVLYGHEKLSFDSNTKIPESTLRYIRASERFRCC